MSATMHLSAAQEGDRVTLYVNGEQVWTGTVVDPDGGVE